MKRARGGFAFPSYYTDDHPEPTLTELTETGAIVFNRIFPTLTNMQKKSILFSMTQRHPSQDELKLLFGFLWYSECVKQRLFEIKERLADAYYLGTERDVYRKLREECSDEMREVKDELANTKALVFSPPREYLKRYFLKISKWVRQPTYSREELRIFKARNKDRYRPFTKSRALNILGTRSGYYNTRNLNAARTRARTARRSDRMIAWQTFLNRRKPSAPSIPSVPSEPNDVSDVSETSVQHATLSPLTNTVTTQPSKNFIVRTINTIIGMDGKNGHMYVPLKTKEREARLRSFAVSHPSLRTEISEDRKEVQRAILYSLNMTEPGYTEGIRTEILDVFFNMQPTLPRDLPFNTFLDWVKKNGDIAEAIWETIRNALAPIVKNAPVFSGFGMI